MEHVIDILWLAVLAESKHSVLLVSFYERDAKAVLEERTLLEGGGERLDCVSHFGDNFSFLTIKCLS